MNTSEVVTNTVAKSSPPILATVLEIWLTEMKYLADTWCQKDVPWWYRERPWIGVLSTALAKYHQKYEIDGFTFEEFSMQKNKLGLEKNGRVDIKIHTRMQSNKNMSRFCCEAKHGFVSLWSRSQTIISDICFYILQAGYDANNLRAYDEDNYDTNHLFGPDNKLAIVSITAGVTKKDYALLQKRRLTAIQINSALVGYFGSDKWAPKICASGETIKGNPFLNYVFPVDANQKENYGNNMERFRNHISNNILSGAIYSIEKPPLSTWGGYQNIYYPGGMIFIMKLKWAVRFLKKIVDDGLWVPKEKPRTGEVISDVDKYKELLRLL